MFVSLYQRHRDLDESQQRKNCQLLLDNLITPTPVMGPCCRGTVLCSEVMLYNFQLHFLPRKVYFERIIAALQCLLSAWAATVLASSRMCDRRCKWSAWCLRHQLLLLLLLFNTLLWMAWKSEKVTLTLVVADSSALSLPTLTLITDSLTALFSCYIFLSIPSAVGAEGDGDRRTKTPQRN